MNQFIFEHYVMVAQVTIAGVLPLMLVAILVTRKSDRFQAFALASLAYLAIVALGMSGNIKHLSPVGFAHALIAFVVAALAAKSLRVRAGWLLWVPCLFIAIVVAFNLANEGIGLELLGRWDSGGARP